MQIRAVDIPEGGKQAELEIGIAPVESLLADIAGVSRILTPLSLKYSFVRKEKEIILKGVYQLGLELNCIKCLECYRCELDENFYYVCRTGPEKAEPEPEEQELKISDLEIYYFDGETIDVGSIFREQLCLDLPQYPHCSEECLGLCVTCGENLNKGPCKCSSDKTEKASPFSVLQKLKEDQ